MWEPVSIASQSDYHYDDNDSDCDSISDTDRQLTPPPSKKQRLLERLVMGLDLTKTGSLRFHLFHTQRTAHIVFIVMFV